MLNAHELLAHAETLTDSVQLVDRILRAGLLLHASDVHMDPAADSVRSCEAEAILISTT